MNHIGEYCRFDSALHQDGSKAIWDRTVLENENFVTIPSLGSIVPGWLMVIPRRHFLNMLEVDDRPGLAEIITKTKQVLEATFGAATVFEHGAATEHSAIGCGVDHAHLHIVSLPFSLGEAISGYQDLRYEWQSVPNPYLALDVPVTIDYLFYQEFGRPSYISLPNRPISQYFRRVIASKVGQLGEFDYRKHSFESNVRATIGQIKGSGRAYA